MEKNVKSNAIFNKQYGETIRELQSIINHSNHSLTLEKNIPVGNAKVNDSIFETNRDGAIGTNGLAENDKLIFKNARTVPDENYIKALVSIFHEQRHLELASSKFTECNPNPDIRDAMISSYIIKQDNPTYYKNNYYHFPTEIDAEFHGIYMTYEYLCNQYPDMDKNIISNMMCGYVNDRIKNTSYYVTKSSEPLKNFDEIENAFDDAMEYSVHSHKRICYINRNASDEVSQILNSKEWSHIADKTYSALGVTKDKMLASVALYKHAEYKDAIDLSNTDLSPETIFDCSFPENKQSARVQEALNILDVSNEDLVSNYPQIDYS